MTTLRVQNTSTFIDPSYHLTDQFKKALREKIGFRDESSFFRAQKWPGYDGMISTLCYGYGKTPCKCAIKKNGMHFPSALLGSAISVFKAFNVPYQVSDERPLVDRITTWSIDPATCEARDYQIDAVHLGLKWGRGIFKIATGGGKTSVAARLTAELGVFPFVVFVTSDDLLKQAAREFEKFLLCAGEKVSVGMVGGGRKDIGDITVMTVQTAIRALCPEAFEQSDEPREEPADGKKKRKKKKKVKLYADEDDEMGDEDAGDLGEFYKEVRKLLFSCGGFICDEVQHWASETCQIVSDYCQNARYRFGMSATPYRDKGDDLLIDSCFGKTICDINASFLIDRNYLVPPNIYFVPVDNFRGHKFDGESYADAYEQGIVTNDVRNNYIINVANSLSAAGRMILILVKNIAHGDALEEMIPNSVFIHGSHSGKVRDEHLHLMRTHQAPITIASTIFDEGIDVRPLDGVILAGSGKSRTRALQRVGRAIRPYSCDGYEKKDAVIVDFYDDMKWMRQHANARRRIYETENRFTIKTLKAAA